MPESRKEIAAAFLRGTASGRVREACEKFVAPNFRHHNPYFAGGPDALMRGMEENCAKLPNKTLEMKHLLEDGNFVAVHSHVRMTPEHLGVAVVHLFRFENDRIVEMWDIGQPVPETSPNRNGMF